MGAATLPGVLMAGFLEVLERQVLVSDGGMGSMIHAALEECPSPDAANLTHPEVIQEIHLRFIEAGAQIIETNTFGANRARLAALGLEDRVVEINSCAVKLAREAREASGREVFVAGSIGPAGHLPDGAAGGLKRRDLYLEQAEALEGRGVDLFVLETFPSTEEVLVAANAVREISRLPIVATLSLPEEWGERPGPPPDAHFRRMLAEGIPVVGMNCGMGPFEMLEILESLGSAGKAYLAVMPNAGVPVRKEGRYLFPHAAPEYFGRFARSAVRMGARIIGGCCGTRPEHILHVARAVAEERPPATRIDVPPPPPPEVRIRTAAEPPPSRLHTMLKEGRFVRMVQLDPPKGTETEAIREAVAEFLKSGLVEAVDVNSNPMARLHLDSLWMAVQIERMGMETVPHVTPRDATLMGLSAQLLGAWSQGIRTVLVVTGDPSQIGDYPGALDVYHADSVGLVRMITRLNQGVDWAGNAIGSPPSFGIGVAVNPSAEDLDLEVDRFHMKVAGGAHFAMTQVFFDWTCWDRFLERLGESPIPILAAVWPLTSHKLALRLHHEVPGILVPEKVQERLRRAGKEARREGLAMAREIYAVARERCAGVYVIAPFKTPQRALEVLEE